MNKSQPLKTFDYDLIDNFPSRYLKTYYQKIDPDESAVISFLVRESKKISGNPVMIDIGCGPTIHHVLPLAPYVSKVDLFDYLQNNIDELKKWKNHESTAHNWNIFTNKVLELEGVQITKKNTQERENLLRKKINKLGKCNVLNNLPLGSEIQYDTVGFFYCAEEVAIDKNEWEEVMLRVANIVKPGGYLFHCALAETNYYSIITPDGNPQKLPTAFITEKDYYDFLPKAGFLINESIIETAQTPEQKGHGINGVILVSAKKSLDA